MTAAQLDRVAAIRPPPPVRIFVLDSPHYMTGLCMWLCERCLKALEAKHWTVKSESDPPEGAGHLRCQECGDDCRRQEAV